MADPRNILTVDDDPDVLEALEMMITAAGHRAVRAHSLDEGLDAFRRERPALAFIDLMMDSVDAGARLAAAIRELDAEVPIYVLSSVGDEMGDQVTAEGLGVDGILQKPIGQELLRRILAERLG